MFKCCYSADSVLPNVPVAIQIREPVKAHRLLKAEPGPIPVLPLNKVEPPTPDLTPEENAKIQANLSAFKTFIKDCWIQQTTIITEVWAQLQHQMNQDRTSDNNSVKKFFEDFFAVGALVDTVAAFFFPPLAPAFGIAAVLCGTISALLCTNGSEVKGVTGGDDISGMAATHFQINDAWYHNMTKTLDYLNDNTNANRDVIFTNTNIKQTATLRSLIDISFEPNGTCYTNWLRLCWRIFKRNLVLPEMAKSENQFLDLYFIQENSRCANVEYGHVYQPCAAPFGYNDGDGTERQRGFSKGGCGDGAVIWRNDEILHYRKDAEDVTIRGTSNDDLKGSWLKATAAFIDKMHCAFIYPWGINNDTIYTQKYFIIEGFAKMRDDQNSPNYVLANNAFLNWLFIDDGVGNITNPDGVAFRYEVFRSKRYGFSDDIFLHAQQISDGIIDAKDQNWITSCSDYIYGPADSKEINEKFHVYTGDLLIKNLPSP